MHKHGTKTTLLVLPADGEPSWSLIPSSVSLLPGSTMQSENIYSCILKVTGQVWECKKRISINTLFTATTNIQLHMPVSTDLTIKPDFQIQIQQDLDSDSVAKMGCEAGRCKTSTPLGIAWMGGQPRLKEAPSPNEVRLALLNTNPAF